MTRNEKQKAREHARHLGSAPPGARRAPGARARRRRRRLRVFYLFLFLAVLAAAVALSLTVLFRIDTIQVTGSSRYAQQEIVADSGIKTGENLFLAKTKDAEKNLEQKLPYIGKATVSRRFPAKIVIDVREAPVSGAVSHEGKYVLIAADGKALELVDKPPESCPVVAGLSLSAAAPGKPIAYSDPDTKELYTGLAQALENSGIGKITKIDVGDPYKLLAEYDGRITLNLGLPSDLDFKLRFAKSVLESKKDTGEKSIGDDEKGVLNLSGAKEENRAYFDPDAVVSSAPASQASGSAPAGSAQASSSQ